MTLGKIGAPGTFIRWSALVVPSLFASLASALPNLSPYQPSGWSDKIVVSKVQGTNTDSAPLTATDTLYVDWAVLNSGTTATAVRFFTELYVDGALRQSWYSDPPLNPNFYSYVEDYSIGSLAAGTHTIRIKTDSTGVIAETNEADNEYTRTIVVGASGGCTAGTTTLCLNGNRFKVQVAWQALHQGTSGTGQAVPLTFDTGYFWFFNSSNVELVIKVLDGRGVNGHYWVFYGALSNVQYTITVTDTQTGIVKTYFNPQDTLASVADTSAFSASSASLAQSSEAFTPASSAGQLLESAAKQVEPAAKRESVTAQAQPTSGCTANATTLCLSSGRFKVQVAWQAVHQGTSGVGQAMPLTADTGYFWFFNSANVELVIKVLDGAAINGNFWVFYGALSDVQYTITVTDTATGAVKPYTNLQDRLASVADTAAFVSSVSPLVDTLTQVATQARMDHENSPAMIRGGAELYNPEVVQLIAAGSSAVPRILDEFRRPVSPWLDETPLSLLAYALEKIGDTSAVPVLATWLQQNLFAELRWAPDFVTHTIKVLARQSGLNTTTYVYSVDEKLDTIAQAHVGNSSVQHLLAGVCSVTAGDPFGVCPEKVIVTGINAQGQQESFTLDYRVSKRDLQAVIDDPQTGATTRANLALRQQEWQSVDQQNYGGSNYNPLPGSVISSKSNCAGTVIEHIINALAAQKGFPVTLPQGASDADQIRNLALKFGGQCDLSAINLLTVISHESTEANGRVSSKHVEVPVQADASSALVYSKDNYGLLRQHTTSKSLLSSNSFLAAQQAYGNRPWYLGGSSPITTRFYCVDPSRIISIVVSSSACPCNPAAPDAIAVAFTSPTTPTTDQRVITVSGTVASSDVSSATLTVNGSPQTIAVASGAFSSVIVLRSGDNSIKVDVTGPTGRRGCATTTIKSTTPKTTISVTLTWNLGSSDVDLYVTQPDGETSWYSHKTTAIGGRLDVDNTQGFGPENYFLSSLAGNTVLAGVYSIRVHYYSDHLRTSQTPTRVVAWRVVILVNEGTPAETVEIFNGSLSTDNSGNASPGSSGPDWATAKQLTFTP